MAKSQTHEGCLGYDVFESGTRPDVFAIIETWESQEALDVHHASPMMGQLAALRDKYDLHMKVERYVSDEAGAPAGDDKFIRK